MKSKECVLHINNSWGYCFTPIKCKSIAEAKRIGYDYVGGFAFSIVCGDRVVYRGYVK